MEDRGHLTTERPNAASEWLDRLSIDRAFEVINGADAVVAAAVGGAKREICRAIEVVTAAFERGGRLIYVGAGTSGRLGVLDAAECPPTFCSDPNMVVGVIAGGDAALRRSIEGAEDRQEDGAAAVGGLAVSERDVVFGITTGGTTPYVHGALMEARRRGAKTVFLACVPEGEVGDSADVSIRVLTGPEVLTGSTRMKAGTATKMVLNMVTTIAMTRIGKVYGNLMVDVHTRANAKLVDRGIRIVRDVTGLSRQEAAALLEKAEGRVKSALVMHARNVGRLDAERLLSDAGGHLHRILPERTADERG
ncbi:MAG: N-acetylmuramic acid 6-phosphate etherase [Phycisphaerales bacterium]|nr:MAG: N-acetylmuramic acid 6-phosphate etherase [Phycisphaerales bacterium]